MLIAVDTNVLMDLAAEVESAVDAIGLVHQRIAGVRWIVLPTVIQELRFIVKNSETEEDGRLAVEALQRLTQWGFEPVNFLPVEHGITEQIALRLRREELLPETEINDSFILAEAALLGCGMLVSSDEHFAALDFQRLTLELNASDVSVQAISSPREILRKFYR